MLIKDVRKQKNLSQKEAAQILGVPLRSFKRYENESKYIGTVKYESILNRLNEIKPLKKSNTRIRKPNIVVSGLGFVGLANGILLESHANISFVDINNEKINLVNKGISPIDGHEFVEAIKNKRFKAGNDVLFYKNADIVIVATPTDLDVNTNSLDTFSVESVINNVRNVNRRCLIVIRSTVPVGFTDKMIEKYDDKIVFFPEFLREKSAIIDAEYPNKLILGTKTVTKKILQFANLVENSIKNATKFTFMSPKEGETTKLFSNAYLAMRVAFFNELDSYSLQKDLDTKKIIKAMGFDPRIGDTYNNPSSMFAGYCLPKDVQQVVTEMSEVKNNNLVNSLLVSNKNRLSLIIDLLVSKAKELTNKDVKDIQIGIFGFDSSKYGNKHRLSSSTILFEELKKRKLKVVVLNEKDINNPIILKEFFEKSDVVYANEYQKQLKPYKNKVICRSINH